MICRCNYAFILIVYVQCPYIVSSQLVDHFHVLGTKIECLQYNTVYRNQFRYVIETDDIYKQNLSSKSLLSNSPKANSVPFAINDTGPDANNMRHVCHVPIRTYIYIYSVLTPT